MVLLIVSRCQSNLYTSRLQNIEKWMARHLVKTKYGAYKV